MSTRGFVGYRHKGIVKGWYNHHDSYMSGLGCTVLQLIYCEYTWEQIKNFFLNKLVLVPRTDDNDNVMQKIMQSYALIEADWLEDETFKIEDGSEFHKDGLYCEYSYIFDLDKKKKTLLLFQGFGEEPSKGYEDWFYTSRSGDTTYYMVPEGAIKGEMPLTLAVAEMQIRIGDFDDEGEEAEEDGIKPFKRKTLKKVLKASTDKLPPLMGICEEIDKIIEFRLRK